jgi:hypothetical protein
MATNTIPFKEVTQVIEDGKKQLELLKKNNPNTHKNTDESAFLLGWLQAHYDTLFKYTLAMHEEKQD